jgi:transcription antitermination factor NusA-like protein
MIKHTPGPWRRHNNYIFSSKVKSVVVQLREEPKHQSDRWEADARLISSAPELLEALIQIELLETKNGNPIAKQMAEIAREAISKVLDDV